MTTVVVGGGIVGVTAAYYLLKQGKRVKLVEKCAIACHSSGKAGGFLTDGDSGWHQGSVARLATVSFALHQELAKELGPEEIGFRRVKCIGKGLGVASRPSWLAADYGHDMGDERGLGQVTPYKLMEALKAAIESKGCEVITGKAVGVDIEGDTVKALKVVQNGQTTSLPCSSLILGMGAWASEAARWFPESSLPQDTVSNRYTSVIWDDTEVGKAATMVFTMGEHHTEIYARSNECYANGCPSSPKLPEDPMEIEPPADEIEQVKRESFAAVACLRDAKVIRTTACFLAGSDDGRPVVGMVPKTRNAVIACGGGCWGILNGPAMGKAAACLAAGEEPPLDLSPFDPLRFDRSRSRFASGLPPKLVALAAQHPQIAEILQEHPERVMELLARMEEDQ